MATESYIKHETPCICTNMMLPKKNNIGTDRKDRITLKGTKDALLNIEDKKLEMTFVCKMPIKKWIGLSMKCLGMLVVGVVLIVVTGGAAAPLLVAGLAIAACGYVGGIIKAAYDVYHDCDQTLDPPSKWLLYHRTVSIEGKKALLNRSIMICPNGGVINIIINPKIAKIAAWRIAFNNVTETGIHLYSQYVYAAVGTLVGGGVSPVGAVLDIGLYCWQEDGTSKVPEYAEDILLEEEKRKKDSSFWDSGAGTLLKEGGNTAAGAGAAVADDILVDGIKNYNFMKNFKGFATGIGVGVLTSLIDNFIVNEIEDAIYTYTVKESEKLNEQDSGNHIGIYAVSPDK